MGRSLFVIAAYDSQLFLTHRLSEPAIDALLPRDVIETTGLIGSPEITKLVSKGAPLVTVAGTMKT